LAILHEKVKSLVETFKKYNSLNNHESIKRFLDEIPEIFKEVKDEYFQAKDSTSFEDAKYALDGINKAYTAGLAQYNPVGSSQYKTALEQIQKYLSPHHDL
jgi:hypothetical protein